MEFACSSVPAWVSVMSKDMTVRLIGDSELSLGTHMRGNGCLSVLAGPGMFSPYDSWERFMDGWMD